MISAASVNFKQKYDYLNYAQHLVFPTSLSESTICTILNTLKQFSTFHAK